MAIFSGAIRSEALAMDTGLTVILPYDRPAASQQIPCKTLYLLHGLGGNHQAWTRYTSIELYARAKGLAVIMPEVQRSFYCDTAYGLDYYTYVAEELPLLCAQLFHIGTARADTYIAGLSMGGYGAVKCAFLHPERYAACASFSGVLDIARAMRDHQHNERLATQFQGILGAELAIPEAIDLLCLAEGIAALPREARPGIFLTCGTEDFLHDINTGFRDRLAALRLDFTYQEWPGDHTWSFWDESMRLLLDHWFPDSE